jgi:hypothetical protein
MSLQSNLALLTKKVTDPPEIFRSVTLAHQAQRGCTNDPQNVPDFLIHKMSEFFKKSPLSETRKHPDFQVTQCLHFDTINVDFAYNESE